MSATMLLLCSLFAFFFQLGQSKCVAYGVDIQDGGSYFQNAESNKQFTFISQFEGCKEDFAYNFLYDPSGREYICTNTTLTPSNKNVKSTCPLRKSDLKSGDYSIVIMSDNGGDEPVAFERDFRLTAGKQKTVYSNGVTVTIPTNYVPSTTVTRTLTKQTTTTVPFSEGDREETEHGMSWTFTGPPKWVTATVTIDTVTSTTWDVSLSNSTTTAEAECHRPARASHPDPPATFSPAVLVTTFPLVQEENGQLRQWVESDNAVQVVGNRTKRLNSMFLRTRDAESRRSKLIGRGKEEVAIAARDLDEKTTTLDGKSREVKTVYNTTGIASRTKTVTKKVYETNTVTVTAVPEDEGKEVITKSGGFLTQWEWATKTDWLTQHTTQSYMLTERITPSALAQSCSAIGGFIS